VTRDTEHLYGHLAATFGKRRLPVEICESRAGFYLGTKDEDGSPFSRESQYWRARKDAERALLKRDWVQRLKP
jgi:hypothetical protein